MKSGSIEAPAQRHPLAAVRAARGWSYQDLVEAVATQSRSLGVPMAARREKAWRWENWGVVPDADSQRALALALGVAPARMGVRPWPNWLPTGAELPADLPWDRPGALHALTDLVTDVEDDQRAFGIAGPNVLADALAAWVQPLCHTSRLTAEDSVSQGPDTSCRFPDDAADPDPLDDSDDPDEGIRTWLRLHTLTLSPLLRATVTADPKILRRRLDADLQLIADLLAAPCRDDRSRRDLYQAAARIALIAGRRCVRDGLHAPGQRYLFTALRCARAAADGRLGAAVLVVVGRHLAALGDADTAARFRTVAESVRAVSR